LKSRYYDPEIGRFITIDDISYLNSESINGLNLYAYCGNNPIGMVDDNGLSPVPNLAPQFGLIVGFLKDLFAGFSAAILSHSAKILAAAGQIPMYIGGVKGAWGSMGMGGAGATLNPAYLSAMTKATNLQYAGKILGAVGKVARVAGGVLLAVDVGLSIYNNLTNPNLSTSRKVTDSIIDVGFSVGSFFASMASGSASGSAIPIPILGTLIGAIAGALFSLGVYFFQQSNLYTDLKVGFNTFLYKHCLRLGITS